MNLHETSPAWPFIRAIAKALTIPGTKIGLSILADLQDQLSADEFHRQVKQALNKIRRDTAAAPHVLRENGFDISPETGVRRRGDGAGMSAPPVSRQKGLVMRLALG